MGVGARSLNLTPESLGEAKLPDIPSVASSIGIDARSWGIVLVPRDRTRRLELRRGNDKSARSPVKPIKRRSERRKRVTVKRRQSRPNHALHACTFYVVDMNER